jgi:tetratricopeptide (TPR) repeat protein
MSDVSRDLIHYLVIPLVVPGVIILIAISARLIRMLWFRVRQRGFPPVAIQAESSPEGDALAARLAAYLAQDKLGADIVIPPGGGPVQRAYPIENMASPSWLSAVIRIVLATEPTFEVNLNSVKYPSPRSKLHAYQATIRITKTPRNRLMASDVIARDTQEDLVHDAATLVIHSVQQDPTVTSHTPRWEHWSSDIRAYSAYRTALQLERGGREYRKQALERYDQAIRYDPANFTITMRRAALLELMRKPKFAADAYRTCKELWPEAIEVSYRLAASYSNSEEYLHADDILNEIIRRLGRLPLWRAWARGSTLRATPAKGDIGALGSGASRQYSV